MAALGHKQPFAKSWILAFERPVSGVKRPLNSPVYANIPKYLTAVMRITARNIPL